jgi:hypothetical protein
VATVHEDYQRVEPGPLYPSAVFHTYASKDTPWVGQTLSHCTLVKYVGLSSNSATVKATQFVGPKKSRMCEYTTQTCSPGPDDRSLTNTCGGYHFRAPNMKIDLSLTFPSGILHNPLVCPTWSQFKPFYQLFKFPTHSNLELGYKKP